MKKAIKNKCLLFLSIIVVFAVATLGIYFIRNKTDNLNLKVYGDFYGGLSIQTDVKSKTDFIASTGEWTSDDGVFTGKNTDNNYAFALFGEATKEQILYLKGTFSYNSAVAFGLTFGVKDKVNPGKAYSSGEFYKYNDVVYRLFSLNSGDIGVESNLKRQLTAEEKTNGYEALFEVMVYPSGDVFYSVNGEEIGFLNDCHYVGGYFGLYVKNGTISMRDVSYYCVTPDDGIESANVDGTRLFSDYKNGKYYYRGYSENVQDTFSLDVQVKDGYTLYVNGTESSGKADIPLNIGENNVFVHLVNESTQNTTVYYYKLHRRDTASATYDNPYRPYFHYSAPFGWTNDYNANWYNEVTGEYHIYACYDKTATTLDATSWMHAVSTDLVHWKQYDVVMHKSGQNTRMFSGCIVIDYNNTTGFFTDDIAPEERAVIVNTYRHNTTNLEYQALAYSLDGGYTFIKYNQNPINIESKYYNGNFRDPRVYWYEDETMENGGTWVMVIAGSYAQLFTSPNLKDWTYNSDLRYQNGEVVFSECPDFYILPLDGDTNNMKWVYAAASRYYIVGNIVKGADGKLAWIAEQEPITYSSKAIYAASSFYNDKLDRKLSIHWVLDSSTSPDELFTIEEKPFNSMASLIYEETLKTIDGKMVLCSDPVDEYTLLEGKTLYSATDIVIKDTDENIFKNVTGKTYKITMEVNASDAQRIEFHLRQGNGYDNVAAYSSLSDKIYLDGKHTSWKSMKVTEDDDGYVKLEIYVDTCLIDIYANDGEAKLVARTFADANDVGLNLKVVNGQISVKSLTVVEMLNSWVD